MMSTRVMLVSLVLALTSCGGDEDCKGACDKLSSCGLKSAGLSCDESCDQGDCSACVNDAECSDIEAGECTSSCPGVEFSKR